jgi:hypothetical protein
MFLDLPDPHPDPLVRDLDPDLSIIQQKFMKNIDFLLFCDIFMTFYR